MFNLATMSSREQKEETALIFPKSTLVDYLSS